MLVDSGTYYPSTPKQPNETRVWAQKEFASILLSLYPYSSSIGTLDAEVERPWKVESEDKGCAEERMKPVQFVFFST